MGVWGRWSRFGLRLLGSHKRVSVSFASCASKERERLLLQHHGFMEPSSGSRRFCVVAASMELNGGMVRDGRALRCCIYIYILCSVKRHTGSTAAHKRNEKHQHSGPSLPYTPSPFYLHLVSYKSLFSDTSPAAAHHPSSLHPFLLTNRI